MEAHDSRIDGLIAALDQRDKPALRAAVDELIPLAMASPGLRARLERRLTEAEHRHSWPTAYVLGNLPDPSASACDRLLEALDHSDPDIRWAIALLLVRIARARPETVESLIRLSAAGSCNQKRMALYAIRDLQLDDSTSLNALFTALQDSEPTVRVASAICLKSRADVEEAGKRRLLDVYLRDPEPRVRHTLAITLAALGNPQPEFLEALKKSSTSEDKQTKKAAIAALEWLQMRRSASSGSASDP